MQAVSPRCRHRLMRPPVLRPRTRSLRPRRPCHGWPERAPLTKAWSRRSGGGSVLPVGRERACLRRHREPRWRKRVRHLGARRGRRLDHLGSAEPRGYLLLRGYRSRWRKHLRRQLRWVDVGLQPGHGIAGVVGADARAVHVLLSSDGPTRVVYVGGAGSGGTVYAVSAQSGAVLWTAGVQNGDDSSPAVTSDGVYVSYACGVSYRFNPSTGHQDWARFTGCEGGGGSTPVVHDGEVYARDHSYPGVLSADTGTYSRSLNASMPPAFLGGEGFYLQGSTLRGVDAATNSVSWSQAADGGLDTAPIVIGSEVAIGSSRGSSTSSTHGQNVWSVDWVGDVGAPIKGWDNRIGLAASGGQLYVPASNTLVAYRHLAPMTLSSVRSTRTSSVGFLISTAWRTGPAFWKAVRVGRRSRRRSPSRPRRRSTTWPASTRRSWVARPTPPDSPTGRTSTSGR